MVGGGGGVERERDYLGCIPMALKNPIIFLRTSCFGKYILTGRKYESEATSRAWARAYGERGAAS